MNYRIKSTDMFGNVSYICVSDGEVSHVSAGGTPLALSNSFSDRTMEVKFALLDAASAQDGFAALLKLAPRYQGGPNNGKHTSKLELMTAPRADVASDLLAACEALLNCIDPARDWKEAKAARAAIAKAKGGAA